jgi:hypothetical protein
VDEVGEHAERGDLRGERLVGCLGRRLEMSDLVDGEVKGVGQREGRGDLPE